jgi:glycosyltransferase involved in cell wall biosynthesis
MMVRDKIQPSILPHILRSETQRFELSQASGHTLSGNYIYPKTHNRFEIRVEYDNGVVAWFSVLANLPHAGGSIGSPTDNCTFKISLDRDFTHANFEFRHHPDHNFSITSNLIVSAGKPPAELRSDSDLILFDVSDLVYYIGHHDNLTGIQRVQACVLMGIIAGHPDQPRGYITFNNETRDFLTIDPTYFESLLQELSLPIAARRVSYDRMDARLGILPNSEPIAVELSSGRGSRLVVYLLGAAWVNRDYFHRILELKRTYDASFCMTVHDLIPIFARDTCDQGTAIVFEEFLRKSFLFTDHYFTVSEYTALDLHKFAAGNEVKNLSLSVVENGHALDEFFPFRGRKARAPIQSEYVLFVSTIEGRKNHAYVFDVWSKLASVVADLPVLVCVGRFGWRAESFLEKMLVSNNLSNKIRVMSDISDAQLEALYENCLFTVYPSFYEGWGLPVGESLCKGKICVSSDRSSIPEVAGEHGVYINIDSVDDGVQKIARLIEDEEYRTKLEQRIRRDFAPRTWKTVAGELVAYVTKLPHATSRHFPVTELGREYKLSQLPPRNLQALGHAMIAQVAGARKASITGYINRDEDLLVAHATRAGAGWYPPEDWGTWSRYPESSKLFFVQTADDISEVVIYEKLRVIAPLVGQSLRVTVNGGPPQDFSIDDEKFIIRIVGQVRGELGGLAEVRIHYQLRNSPDIVPELEKIDGRRLGLGFESTAIMDDSDLGTRVAMLERLLFGGGIGRILAQNPGSSVSIEAAVYGSGSRQRSRSLLVRSEAGARVVDTGEQRSLSSPGIEVGETVLFSRECTTAGGDKVESLLGTGWYPVEEPGVWSRGAEATIHFRLKQSVKAVFVLTAKLRCLASMEKPVRISIIVNNVILGTERFQDLRYRILHYVVDQHISPHDLAFVVLLHCDRSSSPVEFGVGSDTRELGVHVNSLAATALPTLAVHKSYDINGECEILDAFSDGWHDLEATGLWSEERGGRIVGSVHLSQRKGQSSVRISVLGRVYGTSRTGPASVDLLVQGQISASWVFNDDDLTFKHAILPLISLEDCNLLDVRIVRNGSISPSEAGEGADQRKLGLLVSQISFEKVIISELASTE